MEADALDETVPLRRRDWFDTHLKVGAAHGLVIGALGQLAVLGLARGELDATMGQRLAAVGYSAIGWVLVSVVVALLGCRLLGRATTRRLAWLLSAGVLSGLGMISLIGIALRIMSGSFLTAGGVLFVLGSRDHFLHGITSGYLGWMLLLAVAALALLLVAGISLRPLPRSRATPRPRHLAILIVGGAVLVGGYLGRSDTRFSKGMFSSAPLLALAGSLDAGFALERTTSRPSALGAPPAPHGPPLTRGARWREALKPLPTAGPNVLLLMLESLAPEHMGLNGYARRTTPEIDRLAREGLVMERAWATATHSNYAQMAVLSSLFPRRVHGLDQYRRLDYPRVLFHDVFHLLGHRTATISSQDETWQGMRRFQNTATPTFFWHSADYGGEHLDSGVEKVVPDDDTTSEVLQWLKGQRGDSWALYVNFQATHFPYSISAKAPHPFLPDEPTWSTFGYLGYPESEKQIVVNRYDNALAHVDAQVGRIRRFLEDTGQLDNTLWIITADHGEMFFEKGLVTHGKTLYDIEARVPLIMRWPSKIAPQRRDEPVSHLDILPTIFDYLQRDPHPSWQGRSFRKVASINEEQPAIFMNIQGLRFADAVVCWPWKLILERTSDKAYLFNLAKDPAEENNQIQVEAEIAARLNDTLRNQLIAQLDYHRESSRVRLERYQPRLRACPGGLK